MKRAIVFIAFLGCFLMQLHGEGNAASVEMVFVKGGTFQMGTNRVHLKQDGEPESPNADRSEKPAHKVCVGDFYIGVYEITQKEWVAIMGDNPSRYNGSRKPVENVSWFDAVKFFNRLSVEDGFDPVYNISGKDVRCDFNKNGYRLPTEAEWEFSAGGGLKSKGYDYSGSDSPKEAGWLYLQRDDTADVGLKKPNELGIYDMTGNVMEWCWDWFDWNYYKRSPVNNPKGPASGKDRIVRGGSYQSLSVPQYFFTIRGAGEPERKFWGLGLRVARSVR